MNRADILEWLKIQDTTPLVFCDLQGNPIKDIFITKILSIAIVQILRLTKRYYSWSSHKETNPGLRRSVLDIYRHLIYFYPDVDFIDLMKELSKSNRVSSLYCGYTRTRTFYIDRLGHSFNYTDEFGLYIYQWSDL